MTHRLSVLVPAMSGMLLAAGCGNSSNSSDSTTDPVDAGVSTDDVGGSASEDIVEAEQPLVPEFGVDGQAPVRAWLGVGEDLTTPRDLAFNPARPGELWVFDRASDGAAIAFNAGTAEQRTEKRIDAFSNHFMEEVAAAAFAPNGFFATCHESRNTYNDQAPPNDFMGPALWTSDLDVFAEVHQGNTDLAGSHMDMLHQSPLCMGIEHDGGVGMNGYWVADGFNGHLVYYDFREDHGPGEDDHSDGVVRRYPEVEFTRVADVPSHMVLDTESMILYMADTGTGRVLWVDVTTGSWERDLLQLNEPLAEFSEYRGVEWGVFAEGIDLPSGMAMNENRLFVGSYGTGEIIAFDIESGAELGRYDTLSDQLTGIEIGPEGRLWFIDTEFSDVLRIEP